VNTRNDHKKGTQYDWQLPNKTRAISLLTLPPVAPYRASVEHSGTTRRSGGSCGAHTGPRTRRFLLSARVELAREMESWGIKEWPARLPNEVPKNLEGKQDLEAAQERE
jgi:hypothetical protein